MTTATLRDRISKIEERILKKQRTIDSKKALIKKKQAAISKAGFSLDDKEAARENMDIFWLFCDIEFLEDDLRRLPREIEELKTTIQKYQEQLAGAAAKEDLYSNEVPDCLKRVEQELVEKWTAFDIQRKNQIWEARRSLSCTDYRKMFSRYELNTLAYRSDREIRKDNERDARAMVLNLYNRIKDITGEVVDWSEIELTQGTRGSAVLNGVVVGKQGKCRVESIYAEGPVQRLHVRVLTKEIN